MLSYQGKVVLAPMVRVGTLPMRLLALEYGADLVWSPEIVDKKIIGSERIFNARLGTYDYIKDGRTLVFRTHPRERERLVLQLGSADAELALQAAQTVARDVAGIDLNCGCPKHFSIHAGMGAALLRNGERLTSILRRLVQGLPEMPISAKIRLLPDKAESLELIRKILATGIRALTVHCRTPEERPRQPAHHEWLPEVVEMSPIPIIVNGDVFGREDIQRIRDLSRAASVMIARGAQWNASIFRREGMLDPRQVTQTYLGYAVATDNPFSNTKYTVLQMWLDRPYTERRLVVALQRAKTMSDLLRLFGVQEESGGVQEGAGEAQEGASDGTPLLYDESDEEGERRG